jgi:hypothetical protein
VIVSGEFQQPSRRMPIESATLTARLGVQATFPLQAAMRDYALEAGLIDDG